MRRLRRKAPAAKILICAWWRSVEGRPEQPSDTPAETSAATLSEAVAFCIGQASAERARGERAEPVPATPAVS